MRPTNGSFSAGSKGLRPKVRPSRFTSNPSTPLAVSANNPATLTWPPPPLGAVPARIRRAFVDRDHGIAGTQAPADHLVHSVSAGIDRCYSDPCVHAEKPSPPEGSRGIYLHHGLLLIVSPSDTCPRRTGLRRSSRPHRKAHRKVNCTIGVRFIAVAHQSRAPGY